MTREAGSELRTWRDRIDDLAAGRVAPSAPSAEVLAAAREAYGRGTDVDAMLSVVLDIGYASAMETVQRECAENNNLDRVLTRGLVAALKMFGLTSLDKAK